MLQFWLLNCKTWIESGTDVQKPTEFLWMHIQRDEIGVKECFSEDRRCGKREQVVPLGCWLKAEAVHPGTRRRQLPMSVFICRRLESAEVIMMYR